MGGHLTTPILEPGQSSSWAQYTLRHAERDRLIDALKREGIPSAIYYPRPLNRQVGYRHLPTVPAGVVVADRLASEVFSLPMHPYLSTAQQDRIIATLLSALQASPQIKVEAACGNHPSAETIAGPKLESSNHYKS